ncbi:cytochrome c biogenesis protein ResB [Ruania halotolerans]|uniref:cytochrome c biogenesis protein ResB n=1 Tax=Ruania halotolerans TaxID=2897773 RepID=UPI001E4302FD|nr:cytochrome c biogenesis protein ResB [Ruania halotolerans]UFU05824.1 cytochrome c biogenesis protein ResB [Ruania halotolerans]
MSRYEPVGLKDASSPDSGTRTAGGPRLGARGWLRWIWRQLTSMRVALLLLLLLAVVALPGAFFPQRPSDPNSVLQYYRDHPDTAELLETLHLFDVYSSPWFSAVYLLLFTSLIGCIVPRTWSHLRNLRAEPTRVPRQLSRFEVRSELRVPGDPAEAERTLLAALGRRYTRRSGTEQRATASGQVRTISAERGRGRETGNLIFHLALVGLLVVTAWGQLVHYRGQIVVVEGHTFVNAPLDYDSFDTGAWFDADSVEPFRLRLDDFSSVFTDDAQPREFTASVTMLSPDGAAREQDIRLNHPLETDSTRVYLSGNGYAPDVTVTDADGEVAFAGPTMFLPSGDLFYTSNGVIMAPGAARAEEQLGFSGVLLPTVVESPEGEPIGSAYPEAIDPVLVLTLYVGDLGLDDGQPQSLFTLDTTNMEQVTGADGEPVRLVLRPGETLDLPDGLGTITFEDLPRFAALDVRYDPSIVWMGIFAGLAFVGLIGSLFLPRRRVWAKIAPGPGGTTVVTAAALARGDDPGLRRELDRILGPLGEQTKENRS